MLVFIGAATVGGYAWLNHQLDRPGPLAADTAVVIPRGLGVAAVGQRLQRGGIIYNAWVFRLGARLGKVEKALRAGEFAFAAGLPARAVLDVLVRGKTVVRRLTVPEGLSTADIVSLLNRTEGLQGLPGAVPEEGRLLPETYHFSYGDERAQLIGRMAAGMSGLLDELWRKRPGGLPFKTPGEALILASIVEKETGVADERALVAGVFVNRLVRGMRLQSDPTVVYALTQGAGALGRALTRADLAIDSPYNTYKYPGLPPAPICNPGRESVRAVLNPAPTDFLYFVADGSGGHVFARTLSEHNRNVNRWRKIRDGK